MMLYRVSVLVPSFSFHFTLLLELLLSVYLCVFCVFAHLSCFTSFTWHVSICSVSSSFSSCSSFIFLSSSSSVSISLIVCHVLCQLSCLIFLHFFISQCELISINHVSNHFNNQHRDLTTVGCVNPILHLY